MAVNPEIVCLILSSPDASTIIGNPVNITFDVSVSATLILYFLSESLETWLPLISTVIIPSLDALFFLSASVTDKAGELAFSDTRILNVSSITPDEPVELNAITAISYLLLFSYLNIKTI